MKHPISVMIWGCMAATGVGRLHVCQGTINGPKYLEILNVKMLSSACALFDPNITNPRVVPDFVFQQDNAPCHVAKVVTTWFNQNHVTVLDWPGNSPDLNPIENLLRRLKVLVGKSKPRNRAKLIESILHAWNHMIAPQELENLAYSMPRICAAVIKSKGYPSKY